MTHAIKHTLHYLLATMLSGMALICNAYAQAQDAGISGTWLLERGTEFDGLISNPTTDLPPILQVMGDRFVMSRGCSVRLQRERTSIGTIFMNLLKADVTEGEIETFYRKQFNLNIRQVKESLKNDLKDTKCYRGSMDLLQLDNTLVVIEAGGSIAFLYKRSTPIPGAAGEGPYSQLPFRLTSYRTLCTKAITWSNRKPVGVTKSCAPLYFPRIAMASSTDAIARLVGHHNYEGPAIGGRALTNDYTEPVTSGFRPIYQVLPPKGDIALVHVTDEEWSESRDNMTGAYLSIRSGKVVSQLNSNCTMGLDYVCREVDSVVHYTMNSKGEFVEHDR